MTNDENQTLWNSKWWNAAFLAFALLFFIRSYSGYFVCDDYLFLGNINFQNAGSYLTKSWYYGNEYRPLIPFSYALDGAISHDSPIGYHLTSTLLHAGNAMLIASLIVMLGKSRRLAHIASLCYLLNPVGDEAVLWISGRTAVLSVFFILICCYCFLRAAEGGSKSAWLWVGAYVFFVLSLGAYEVSVVVPLLTAFLCWIGNRKFSNYRVHSAVFFAMTATYVVLWYWFFEFKITRFPVEHSIIGGLTNLGSAVLRSFHGSTRPLVAAFYLAVLIPFWRNRSARMLTLAGAVWFVLAYLPFFVVHGYANRFAYLSSAGSAVVIAAALESLATRSKALHWIAVALTLGFLGTGLQNRITAWNQAGEIARTIVSDIKRDLPVFPSGRPVFLLKVPPMHKTAYVFITGLKHALQRQYPGMTIDFETDLDPAAGSDSVILEYSGGHMVRRNPAELNPSR